MPLKKDFEQLFMFNVYENTSLMTYVSVDLLLIFLGHILNTHAWNYLLKLDLKPIYTSLCFKVDCFIWDMHF